MLNLPKQSGDPSRVTRSTSAQIRRDDLTCIGIDSEVQPPPSPSLWRFPQVTDVLLSPVLSMSRWIVRRRLAPGRTMSHSAMVGPRAGRHRWAWCPGPSSPSVPCRTRIA